MKSIDLAGYKKSYMTVKLPESNTIHVDTPSKDLYSEMMSLAPDLTKLNSGLTKDEALEMFTALYTLVSSILSRNREKVVITVEYLDDHFDTDTILTIFNSYLDFVAEVAVSRSKN